MTETGLPVGRVPILRVPAMPSEVNQGGTIFGGWIMSQVDIAGSIPARIRAAGPIVTRAVTSFEFKMPVFMGDLINCYAEIRKEGKTSIDVFVEVYAQRIKNGVVDCVKVTEATVVYVAIDDQRRPRIFSKK